MPLPNPHNAPGDPDFSEIRTTFQELLNQLLDNLNNEIKAKDVRDSVYTLWDRINNVEDLISTLEPLLTMPSVVLTASAVLLDVLLTNQVTLTATFNKGKISPLYGTSPLADADRSGNTTNYKFGYLGTDTNQPANTYTYTDSGGIGTKTASVIVSYAASSIQPKDSKGNNYLTPLGAGTVSATINIETVFPFFATSNDIDNLLKQSLISSSIGYYEFNLKNEVLISPGSAKKQKFELHNSIVITGIQQLNTISNNYEWLGGDKVSSKIIFDTLFDDINLPTNTDYKQYSYNGPFIGERRIRIYHN